MITKRYLHKSILLDLELLTSYLKAEAKKRTGIQLIRVSDANGNVYQRYYDFDKGEFAANPNKEMPREELKKYRGLRNKDISSSIASLSYVSPFEGEEEALWKEVAKEFKDLSPEQEADTQSILTQLTATNSGWSIGMQILGDEVALGFEDGLKSIETNIDKGLSATATALNTLWDSVKDNKPLKDGILLAGSLAGSIASAVKGFSILSGGFEGLATKSLLAGVGLEFAAAALGSFFVGKAIKTFVMPKIEEWKKAHPPKSNLDKSQERIKRLQERTKGNQKKQLVKDLDKDQKEIVRSLKETDQFIQRLAHSEISWSQQLKEKIETENEEASQNKVDTSKGVQKFNPFAYGKNLGIDNSNSFANRIKDGTEQHAYQDLLTKVNNKELLLEDAKRVETLGTELAQHEKTLNQREETLNKLNFEPEDKTPLLEQIKDGRSAIESKKIELYAAMFTESELVREYDTFEKEMELMQEHKGLRQTTGETVSKLSNAKQTLRDTKAVYGLTKIQEKNIQIPNRDPSKAPSRSDYNNALRIYNSFLNKRERIENMLESLQQKGVKDKLPQTYQQYKEELAQTNQEIEKYIPIADIDKEVGDMEQVKELTLKVETQQKEYEELITNVNNISIEYKTKLQNLVGNIEATPEEIQEVAPDFIGPLLPQ